MAESAPKRQKTSNPTSQLVKQYEMLENIQDELEKIDEEASEKILAIEQQYNSKRNPFYEQRQTIIKGIPNFWLKTFCNHAVLSDFITEEDKKVLSYLDSMTVNDSDDIKSGWSIKFQFEQNPYFSNTELWKKFSFQQDGTLEVSASQINWNADMNITATNSNDKMSDSDDEDVNSPSFFTWFSDDEDLVIGEIIKDDIWQNPSKFFHNSV